jgi:hypothetical protein
MPLQQLFASFYEQPEGPAAKSLIQMIVIWLAVSSSAAWKAILEQTRWGALEPVRAKHFVGLALHRPVVETWRTIVQPEILGMVYLWEKQRQERRIGSVRVMIRLSGRMWVQLEGKEGVTAVWMVSGVTTTEVAEKF